MTRGTKSMLTVLAMVTLLALGIELQSQSRRKVSAQSPDNVFVITKDGNVGIGTVTPDEDLVVNSAGPLTRIAIDSDSPRGNTGFRLRQNGNSKWSVATVRNGDYTIHEDDGGGDRFYIVGNGPNRGNVGIGTISPRYKLDVAGPVHAASFPTSSDARLKTYIVPITGALEKLEQIRGVSFQWNKPYESLGSSAGKFEIGVIAQEVEAVFPELVTTYGEEGYIAVDYGRLTAVLIEATKELKAKNEALEHRLSIIENATAGE